MPKKKSPEKKPKKTIKKNPKENQKKQIKLLKSVIENLINKQSVEIIDLLAGKKNVNEFAIAKNLKLTINQTRNILYKLSDYGLVSFIRKKDKRKGWYIYFWTLNTHQALSLLNENLTKKLEIYEKQIKNRKESRHYICNTCSVEVSEETALLNNFICPECDEVYELSDDSEVIEDIDKKILKIKKEIKLVSEEKKREEGKLELIKLKKIKKAEAERKLKRAMTAKKTKLTKIKKAKEAEKLKALKKKPTKKLVKKKPKKKIAKKKKPTKKLVKKKPKKKIAKKKK